MKRVVIFYLWGRKNAGDMAINLGAISLLNSMDTSVTFVSKYSTNQTDYIESVDYIKKYHPDINIESGIFYLDRDRGKIHNIFSHFIGLIRIIFPYDSRVARIIKHSDIVCINGGNLLRGENFIDYARLYALFYPIKIAKKYKKVVMMLPQSTAKSSKTGKYILKKYLKNCKLVFIREGQSLKNLQTLDDEIKFVQSIDLAFFIKSQKLSTELFKSKYQFLMKNKDNVAIILRGTTIGDLGELTNTQKNCIINQIHSLISQYKNKYNFYFVVQTKKDYLFSKEVSEEILTRMQFNVDIIEEYDSYILREIYQKMKFVISMRLHAIILSLSTITPALGYFDLKWGLKNPGIMEDIKLPWKEIEQGIVSEVKDIENNYEQYKVNIEKYIESNRINIINNINSVF